MSSGTTPRARRSSCSRGAPRSARRRATARSPRPTGPRSRETFERYAGRGLRVLGFAQRKVAQVEDGERDLIESHLSFVGLAALADPPRPEVADAVARCQRAGIRIIVVTGDHGLTADAIAREVGIVDGKATVINGAELDAMPDPSRDALAARRRPS